MQYRFISKWGISGLLCIAVLLNVFFWFGVRNVQARWINVPPVPDVIQARLFSLDDPQLSYRTMGLSLQNLGDTGGQSRSLKDYDYQLLVDWFFLMDELDTHSQYIPFLAAFYFGSVQDSERLRTLIPYLRSVGMRPAKEQWRWLAHAVYLARFQMNDLHLALDLSHQLAGLNYPGMPLWTKQMPAFIYNAKGDQKEALAIMFQIMESSAETMHPNEFNFMRSYMCERLMSHEESQKYAFCSEENQF